MPIRARKRKGDYVLPTESLYLAVCSDITDPVEEAPYRDGEEPRETITIHWLLDTENPKTGRPFEVQTKCNLSMFAGRGGQGGSRLYQLVRSWLGTNMTQEEADNFDLETLLGQPCQLQVIHHDTDDGRTFANVGGIFPLKQGMVAPPIPPDYVRRKDRAS